MSETTTRQIAEGDLLLAQLLVVHREAPYKGELAQLAKTAVETVAREHVSELLVVRQEDRPFDHTDFYVPLGSAPNAQAAITEMRTTLHDRWSNGVMREIIVHGILGDTRTEIGLFRRVGGLIVPGFPIPTDEFEPPTSPALPPDM
jgi:hypothetical protein